MNQKQNNPLAYQPIRQLLFSLAIPSILANLVNAFYNIVDQIFIGQSIGYLGNAATNIAFPLTTLCMAIGLMTGIGAAANFNLELGRNNPKKATLVAGTAASSLIICGLIVALLVFLFLDPLLLLFGATEQLLPYAKSYTSIICFGIPFLLFSTGINPLIRADGSPSYCMVAIVTGAVLNIILDYLFIYPLQLGIAGAAIATVISQLVAASIKLAYFRKPKHVQFTINDFIPKISGINAIVSLGFASFIFQFSNLIIQILTNNLLKNYGATSIYGSDITIAVAGIVMKINVIFLAIIIGFVQGSQPICGFNYGAKNYHRVKETVVLLLRIVGVISFVAWVIFQLFPRQIISIFGHGDELYFAFGESYMRHVLLFVCLNGIQISSATFFPSIGKAIKGAIISLSKQLLFLIPLLLYLPTQFGLMGILYAPAITDLLSFVVASIFLYQELKKMSVLEEKSPM